MAKYLIKDTLHREVAAVDRPFPVMLETGEMEVLMEQVEVVEELHWIVPVIAEQVGMAQMGS